MQKVENSFDGHWQFHYSSVVTENLTDKCSTHFLGHQDKSSQMEKKYLATKVKKNEQRSSFFNNNIFRIMILIMTGTAISTLARIPILLINPAGYVFL